MILKCKMCGGGITVREGKTSVRCEYCGSNTTLPKVDDERVAALYNRANQQRMQKDFDKAELAYEAIALERPEDAEAYWCAMLCHYGVEYVKDPYSGEQLPTLHRMQTEPVLKDMNYLRAAALADPAAKELYEREAGRISVIQDRFLTISSKEKPFDAFICYKETDENGGRTPDSVYAQEIYDALTARGHHVFFSRITLENKLGEAYEPYIFAALNSARVMLVVGTRAAYLQSEWVRNEWKRFLYLMESDPAKRLIPVYRDMDAYELPEEFAYLQAQDYGKIGAQQDLLRGVEKFIGVKRGETDEAPGAQPRQAPQPASVHAQPPRHAPGDKISPLMRRAELFLEDGELDEAEAYFNRVLDLAPEYAPAYMGKVRVKLSRLEQARLAAIDDPYAKAKLLGAGTFSLEDDPDYRKAMRFSSTEESGRYAKLCEDVLTQIEQKTAYREARVLLHSAGHPDAASLERAAGRGEPLTADAAPYRRAAKLLRGIPHYRDADALAPLCEALARSVEQLPHYQAGMDGLKNALTLKQFALAAGELERAGNFRDAPQKLAECRSRAKKLAEEAYAAACGALYKAKTADEFQRVGRLFKELAFVRDVTAEVAGCECQEQECRAREEREREERRQREREALAKRETLRARLTIIAYSTLFAVFIGLIILATVILPSGHYRDAESFLSQKLYAEASEAFGRAGAYSDAEQRVGEPYYLMAEELLEEKKYAEASEAFTKAGEYSDAANRVGEPYYTQAEALLAEGKWLEAVDAFTLAGKYRDAKERMQQQYYAHAEERLKEKKYAEASEFFKNAGAYSDAAERVNEPYYVQAEELLAEKKYAEASKAFKNAGAYSDAAERVGEPYYVQAEELLAEKKYAEASKAFKNAGAYSDAAERVGEPYYVQGQELLDKGERLGAAAAFKSAGSYMDAAKRSSKLYYQEAKIMLSRGKEIEAGAAFKLAGNYADAMEQAGKIYYLNAERLLKQKKYREAAWSFMRAAGFQDALKRAYQVQYDYLYKGRMSTTENHSVGVMADGTVVASGKNPDGQCNVQQWSKMLAVSAAAKHTVGLRSDGVVAAVGRDEEFQCRVNEEASVVAISVEEEYSVLLWTSGKIGFTGTCNTLIFDALPKMENMVAISAEDGHFVGLKSDGTVVAVGKNNYGQCDVEDWRDIVEIATGKNHTVGLKADGTVEITGSSKESHSEVGKWRDIVSVAARDSQTIGLKADGTVVVGLYGLGDETNDVAGWKDIVAIEAGYKNVLGLKSDGTVVAAGSNENGELNVTSWNLLKTPKKK